MVIFGLQSGLPWLMRENIDKCLFCSSESEDLYQFVFRCPYFRNGWTRFWMLLKNILIQSNDVESELLFLFLRNLSDTCRLRFLTNGLKLPFSSELCVTVQKFVAISMRKIYRIRLIRLILINYLFISLVFTLLVQFFAGTYFRYDEITIYCVCLLLRISQVNAGFSFKNSQNCLKIIPYLSKTAKSVEVGTGEK